MIVELRNRSSKTHKYVYDTKEYEILPGDLRWMINFDTMNISIDGKTGIIPYPSRRTRDRLIINIVDSPKSEFLDELEFDTELEFVAGQFYHKGKPTDISEHVKQDSHVFLWCGLCFLIILVLLVGVLWYSGASREKITLAHF